MLYNRICIPFLLVIVLSSCVKEKFDPAKFKASQNLDPGLTVPVGYSKIEMQKYLRDAIANNQLKVSPDGLLSLIYSDSVSSGTMDNLLSFPTISKNKVIPNASGFPISLPAGGPGLVFSDTIQFPVSLLQTSGRIDSIRFRSGSLQTSIAAAGLSGTITYQFPGLQLGGKAFIDTMSLSESGLMLSLKDYILIPLQKIGGANMFQAIISVDLDSTSTPIAAGADILSIQTDMNKLKFETIFGDLSGFDIPIPPVQLAPGAFTKIIDGKFSFADPKINLYFSNSIGVPIGLFFNKLEAVMRDNSIVSLKADEIPTPPAEPRPIAFPSLNQAGQVVHDTIRIKRSNSNLPDFFSSNVNAVNISPAPRIGPPTGSEAVFVRYDSKIDLKASIEIPLWGRADFFMMMDTISFDYLSASLPVPEELDSLIARIRITNSFPVSVAPQVYLLDQNKVLLDSLIRKEQIIEGAVDTNDDGKVDPSPKTIEVPVSRSTINILGKTRYLVTKGSLMTTGFLDNKDVKFYLSYYLEYNIGLIAQLKIKTGK